MDVVCSAISNHHQLYIMHVITSSWLDIAWSGWIYQIDAV